VALTGSLQEIEPADLIQLVVMGRKSGVLTVTQGRDRTILYFREGRLIHAEGTEAPDPRQVVYTFVGKKKGNFVFETREPGCTQTLHGTAEALVLEGMRRLDHEQRLLGKLPPGDQRLVVLGGRRAGANVELTGDQARVLLLVDGERTVDEVVRRSGLSRLFAYEALAELLEQGVVRAEGPPRAPATARHPDPKEPAERAVAAVVLPQAPRLTVEALTRMIEHVSRM